MSVINKKEFFLVWVKQTVANVKEKFEQVDNQPLAREILKEKDDYKHWKHFVSEYGEAKITSNLLVDPNFLLDFLILHNPQEFYPDVTTSSLFTHVLHLLKAFFKKRILDGRNLFKVLGKLGGSDLEVRLKVVELVFVVCFFCKDRQTEMDFYYLQKDNQHRIFNNACDQLHADCNPMLTKCVF